MYRRGRCHSCGGVPGAQSVPPEIATQANCLLDKAGADRLGCLVPDGAGARALKQLQKCQDRKSRACAVEAALPPEWACVASAQSAEDLQCLAAGVGGNAAHVAQCLAKHQSDVAARIVCIGGSNIPNSVKRVVDCYMASTEALVAVCVIGSSLPPEQAAVVKCAAESGGDVMAAGVCVAARRLRLKNPGQQIMLQCAASSGGVPATAAACIVGRFTLNELQGCRTADFSESGCFGEGNEFQKLAKSITGKPISKNSFVGQIVIKHIEVADAAIGGFSHALNELSKGGKNTIEGFNHEMKKIRENPIKAALDARGNIEREVVKGVRNVLNNLNPVNWHFY